MRKIQIEIGADEEDCGECRFWYYVGSYHIACKMFKHFEGMCFEDTRLETDHDYRVIRCQDCLNAEVKNDI